MHADKPSHLRRRKHHAFGCVAWGYQGIGMLFGRSDIGRIEVGCEVRTIRWPH